MEGQTGWIMKWKRYNRKKRIIIAYTLRTVVGIVLAAVLVLMVCGVLFIYERMTGNVVFGKTVEASAGENGLSNVIEELYVKHTAKKNIRSGYENYRIILDAGHGGSDGGTQADGNRSNVIEKDINLAVVLRMKSLLEELGAEVMLTREEDETLSLDERVGIANSMEADLYVSIHCNYYEDDASISGLECYYFEESDSGKKYAEKILEKIEDSGNVVTRNVKESEFYVLKWTKIPAVLVEIGYLSNARESQLLVDAEYQETMANELTEGILKALNDEAAARSF